MSNDMHPDLEWLAENVSEWPSEAKARSHGIGWHGWNHDGRKPDFIRRVDPLSDEYTEAEWLKARQDLGLIMSDAGEELPAKEWVGSITDSEEEAEMLEDMVNHPPHYTQGGIECIEAIKAAMTPEEFRGYCKAAALKYIWRERHKGGDESLRKAVWYLNKTLESGE